MKSSEKTKAETLIKEYGNDRAEYVSTGRMLLQRSMDGHYKEGLIEEGDQYRKAIVDLDKKFGVKQPIDRLPAAVVKVDLKKGKVVQIIQ